MFWFWGVGLLRENETDSIVSIITVVYNNVNYIQNAIESVLSQDYPLIEYIVVDGGSKDGTLDVIEEYRDKISVFLSEPDDGIYDALNKGISLSTGEVIAILHSDDQFSDNHVVSDIMEKIYDTKAEFCFSDLVIVDHLSNKILRYYMAHYFSRWLLRIGWLPPHPTCFIKKSLFNEFGLYSTEYKLAGDFDFMVRIFYGRDIKWTYLDRISVKMGYGGESNSGFYSKYLAVKEVHESLKNNGVLSLRIFQSIRYIIRIFEYIIKPKG